MVSPRVWQSKTRQKMDYVYDYYYHLSLWLNLSRATSRSGPSLRRHRVVLRPRPMKSPTTPPSAPAADYLPVCRVWSRSIVVCMHPQNCAGVTGFWSDGITVVGPTSWSRRERNLLQATTKTHLIYLKLEKSKIALSTPVIRVLKHLIQTVDSACLREYVCVGVCVMKSFRNCYTQH